MNLGRFAFGLFATGVLFSCNTERKRECDEFLAALNPLEGETPAVEAVDRAYQTLQAMTYQDQPLREYALSTKATLNVLSNTLKVQASPSPPDGTDNLIKDKLKELRGERDDVTRYCAQ